MKIEKMKCKDVISHICENLGEEKNSDKCIELKKHLEECPCCQNYYNTVGKTIELYKCCGDELSEDAHKRLMEKLGLTE